MDEDNPETPSIDAEETAVDESKPATVICPYCCEENNALELVSSQVNRCWKCGQIVGSNNFVPSYDIKSGRPNGMPTGTQFMWMLRLSVVFFIILLIIGLLFIIWEIVK